MKRFVLSLIVVLWAASAFAQELEHYYDAAEGLTGDALKVALHNIIKGHNSINYSDIWDAYWSTDNKGEGVVWDMYSDIPGGDPPYTFEMVVDQCDQDGCGSEGDCYNREHSWPQSWFKKQETPRTDLHHIFPTDGYVNNRRGNFPFGEVRSASWTSQNGSKLGTCKTPGYSGTVFEPIDEYKGDFARAIMYMSVRYYGEDGSWGSSDMTNKSEILPWAINMLMRWNEQDPVSQKEIDRNNAICNDYQYNRNPFVDHPEYARMIWDPSWNAVNDNLEEVVYLFPNPVEKGQKLHVSGNCSQFDAVVVCDLCGHTLLKATGHVVGDFVVTLPNDLVQGCYIVKLMCNGAVVRYEKLMIK